MLLGLGRFGRIVPGMEDWAKRLWGAGDLKWSSGLLGEAYCLIDLKYSSGLIVSAREIDVCGRGQGELSREKEV